jgi:hypothetical protein
MRSIVQKTRLDDLLQMDTALRQARLGVQLAEAMAQEAILLSAREASLRRGEKELWTHALIERFPANPTCSSRKEIWIMFQPEEIELASKFHSYPYWKRALERGDTVLCSGKWMSWNILSKTDKVLMKVKSSKALLSEWEMKEVVKETSKKFGL